MFKEKVVSCLQCSRGQWPSAPLPHPDVAQNESPLHCYFLDPPYEWHASPILLWVFSGLLSLSYFPNLSKKCLYLLKGFRKGEKKSSRKRKFQNSCLRQESSAVTGSGLSRLEVLLLWAVTSRWWGRASRHLSVGSLWAPATGPADFSALGQPVPCASSSPYRIS